MGRQLREYSSHICISLLSYRIHMFDFGVIKSERNQPVEAFTPRCMYPLSLNARGRDGAHVRLIVIYHAADLTDVYVGS